MHKSMLCTVAAAIALCSSIAGAQNPDSDDLRVINLFERNGECVVVGKKPAPFDARGNPVKPDIPLPKLKTVPTGPITRLETDPYCAETLRKYPDLRERQRRLDAANPPFAMGSLLGGPAVPLYQMFDQWLGVSSVYVEYYETNMDGKTVKSPLGRLSLPPYDEPPVGVWKPSYKQPRADLAKPILLYVNGRYYSVYGDCQLAEHVPVKGFPENLAAFRYAGNPIYACSEELPAALQSCGVDKDGVIWLADIEGHIAFFRTKTSDFAPAWATIEKAKQVLVPRNNVSQCVFALDDKTGLFQEYHVEVGGKASAPVNPRALPAEATCVLYCDAARVVFLTADKCTVRVRNGDDKEQLLSPGLGKDEKVWEGVYLSKTNEVRLLVGPVPQVPGKFPEYAELGETRKSWDHMRLLVVSTSDAR